MSNKDFLTYIHISNYSKEIIVAGTILWSRIFYLPKWGLTFLEDQIFNNETWTKYARDAKPTKV